MANERINPEELKAAQNKLRCLGCVQHIDSKSAMFFGRSCKKAASDNEVLHIAAQTDICDSRSEATK